MAYDWSFGVWEIVRLGKFKENNIQIISRKGHLQTIFYHEELFRVTRELYVNHNPISEPILQLKLISWMMADGIFIYWITDIERNAIRKDQVITRKWSVA